ncbi:Hypothetical protein BPA_0900021 (plasmid) [Borrelia parkeri SLO]|uniref:Uncharacterized protein n=2 Tax=Borrelia parkeri SLO TaxID=1313294 RepID=W5ST04_BORPR|nr:hypothetical protein [Borrelia parkeri]AHH10070.1 Hypothetical protein BPA_0900021 [Borrelia parkeri SLO]UPA11464.1 hypothetical protein bpSLO_001321 [Borrelia parkeri]
MFSLKNLFTNKIPYIPIHKINPDEFILISNYLILSSSTIHNLLGIIMASGIPLTHLKDPFIKIFYTFNNNIITYTLSNGLQFQQYSLLEPNVIATSIKNLNKNILSSIHAYKINYIAKNIFNFSITTKHIISIYSLIAKSKNTFNNIYYNNTHLNILLDNQPCILDLYEKINYIKSFNRLKLNKNNLDLFKNHTNKNLSTIASLVESFFLDQTSNKNLHTLKSYINLHLKQLGIPYKSTNRLQKQLLSHIFL